MKRLILLVLFCLAAARAAQADIIYVQGDVSGTWAADTVMVTGEVRVPSGMTLVIEPGVKVLFTGNFALEVLENSILEAIGTATDSIFFTAEDTAICHHGLHFLSASDSSILKYCSISYGEANETVTLSDSCGGGIFCYYSSVEITNCRISHCYARYGGGGGYIGLNSNAQIHYNEICQNYSEDLGCGLYCFRSAPSIFNNNIMFNEGPDYSSGGGVFADRCILEIQHNKIINNAACQGGGIYLYYCEDAYVSENIIEENDASGFVGGGGGIRCITSNVLIINNVIVQNTTTSLYANEDRGGGIHCSSTMSYEPGQVSIIGNVIIQNSSQSLGGGIYFSMIVNSEITENIICDNSGDSGGGLFVGGLDNSPVSMNYFIANSAIGTIGRGGGIESNQSENPIMANIILYNHASNDGGGIMVHNERNIFMGNSIIGNSANDEGSGLFSENYADPYLVNCTFYYNDPSSLIGAYWFADPIILGCILGPSGNISPASIEITYSDILSGWPGLGNISLDPAFVDTAHDDYRLLWGSPCIDAGHPDSLDPDGTRADMGALFYDQSKPVRILLTPHEIPYLIPDSGGTMTYTLRLDTHLEEPQTATFWCDVTLPDSSILGPLLGPATVDVYPNQMVSWVRYQGVPGTAPLGVSHYNAYAVVGSDTSKDSFMFGVLGFGSDIQDPWPNVGDPLGVPPAPLVRPGIPTKFALHPPHPNPFNAKTVASYELRVASEVSLRVYDTAGKLVRTLVKGWMPAGFHRAVFDGRDLPSGIYICRFQAGNFEGIQKMVLLK